MSLRNARAFVLERRPFRTHDLLVDVLLDDGERALVLAPSGQRSRLRFAGGLPPLVLHTFTMTPSAQGLRLDEACIERTWPALHTDLTRQTAALLATGLLHELSHPPPGDPTDFLLLGELYDDLAKCSPPEAPPRLLRFSMEVLTHAGLAPVFDRCVRCQTEAPEHRPVTFEPTAGGVVCRHCGGGSHRLAPEVRSALRAVLSGDRSRYVPGLALTFARVLEGPAPTSAQALTRAIPLLDRPWGTSLPPSP